MRTKSSTSPFEGRKILLCAGPGGVGKTTCASALALALAEQDLRVAVVTVDPSRRLAQALGLDEPEKFGGQPVVVEQSEKGQLDALVLDGARVFDVIVEQCANSPEAARRILENPIYRATSQRLSGALEYAAMARVQMLHEEQRYDLIIVDTPPTANAIDFLESPRKVRELIDNPAARVLAGTGKIGFRLMDLGGAAILRQLENIAGTHFLSELGRFLREFSDVLAEFQRRGGDFETLMSSSETGVVLVTSSAEFSVREATDFLQILRGNGLRVDGVLLNRVDPELVAPPERSRIYEAIRQQLGDALADAATDLVLDAYEGAYVQGQRCRAAEQELSRLDSELPIWSALRRKDAPQTLDALRDLGREILAG